MSAIRLYIMMMIAVSGICVNAGPDAEKTGAGAPKLEAVGAASIDFGKFPANQSKEASFTLKNSGSKPLEVLKVFNSCGCSKLQLSSRNAGAGETFTVSFALDKGNLSGKFEKNIYLQTNDPANQYFQLKIVGEATPLFTVTPSTMLYAGTLEAGKVKTLAFKISLSDKGQTEASLGEPSLASNHPAKVALRKEDGGGYALDMEVTPSAQPASLQCSAKIPIASPTGWESIEIIVSGAVKGK